MIINGSRALLECLKREGVDTIFGYPGGAVIPIYDMIYQFPDIRHILVRHEQGAGHMAEGYALATGKVGVCLATSGPGATNLVTPIADAMMDSVPLVAITGQVKTSSIGTDAFQEADITGITMPITKHNWLVKDVTKLPEIIAEAFHIARSGRPGPVLIDIPVDISRAEFEYTPVEEVNIPTFKPTVRGHSRQIQRAAELIAEAKRPVLYVGGGAIYSGAHAEVLALAELTDTPVTTTLKGLGAFPETHPLSLGMLGMHGTAYANYAISECDLLIAVGARFDDRVTGKAMNGCPQAKIIHIDVDPAEIGKVLVPRTCRSSAMSKPILTELLKFVRAKPSLGLERAHRLRWKQDYPLHLSRRTAFCTVSMSSSRSAKISRTMRLSSSQMSASIRCGQPSSTNVCARVSSSHPAASARWGSACPPPSARSSAQPDKPVFCVSGDGSIQMCIQELMVATIYKLPIKICILNNQYLGMVRQWQELFWESKYSNVDLEASPDFLKLAEAYGAHGIRCSQPSGVRAALDEAMSITDRPTVLDFRIAKEENVYPMIKSGGTIRDMVVQRPPEMVPLDTYMASETYMDEVESRPAHEDEKTEREPVTVGQELLG